MSDTPGDIRARLVKFERHQAAQRVAIATLASLILKLDSDTFWTAAEEALEGVREGLPPGERLDVISAELQHLLLLDGEGEA